MEKRKALQYGISPRRTKLYGELSMVGAESEEERNIKEYTEAKVWKNLEEVKKMNSEIGLLLPTAWAIMDYIYTTMFCSKSCIQYNTGQFNV